MALLSFDLRDFERRARQLGAAERQIPFALAEALNAAVADTKTAEEQSIKAVFDRPTPFTQRAIGRTYAKKHALRAELFVYREQQKYLRREWKGGPRPPKRKALPVPAKVTRLNAYGNMPKGAVARAFGAPNTFTGVPKGLHGLPAGVWQRPARGAQRKVSKSQRRAGQKTGRQGTVGATKGLTLLMLLSGTQRYDPRFPFDAVFASTIRARLPKAVAAGVRRAMATAR